MAKHPTRREFIRTSFLGTAGLALSSRGTAREAAPTLRLLHRGMVKPSAAEIARNPRSRSARLRAAVRTEAPLEAAV